MMRSIPRQGRRRGERGLSIVITLLVLLVVAVIGMAVAGIGTQNLSLAAADRNAQTARYAAQAGQSDAVKRLKADPTLNDQRPNTTLIADEPMSGIPDLSYTVVITNNFDGRNNLTAADGTVVMPGKVYVVSTGTLGASKQGRRTISALYTYGTTSIFSTAAFGVDQVGLQGTSAYTDSWDSSSGNYASTRSNSDSSIGTMSTTNDRNTGVDYTGGAVNYGNVWIGPGGVPSETVAGSGYQGAIKVLPEPLDTTPKEPPSSLASPTSALTVAARSRVTLTPGAYTDLTVGTHAVVTFSAGTYYFSGDVSFGSQVEFRAPSTGEVKVYVGGTWNSGGGSLVNGQGVPSSFQIYGTSTCTEITVNGGNDAFFVVYAPTAEVTVQGNSDVYGAIVGRDVKVAGNAKIHYDRALSAFDSATVTMFRESWKM